MVPKKQRGTSFSCSEQNVERLMRICDARRNAKHSPARELYSRPMFNNRSDPKDEQDPMNRNVAKAIQPLSPYNVERDFSAARL